MRGAWLLLALAGCAVDGVEGSLPGEQAAPPEQLTPAWLVRGERVDWRVRNLAPRSQVRLGASLAGEGVGPCPPSHGGACFGIAGPVTQVASGRTNAAGSLTLSFTVPAGLPGDTVWAQVMTASGFFPVVPLPVFDAGVDPTLDHDSDGLSTLDERTLWFTDPDVADTDGDGVTDGDEVRNGGNPLVPDAPSDSDSDGLSDSEENTRGTDPFDPDTDGDTVSDGDEVLLYGSNPLRTDSDFDFLVDGDEVLFGTDLMNPDTDGDFVGDGVEGMFLFTGNRLMIDTDGGGADDLREFWVGGDMQDPDDDWLAIQMWNDPDGDRIGIYDEPNYGCDNNNPDTDGDGLLDGDELAIWLTDPVDPDTDNDGVSDGAEIAAYTDPYDPAHH